MNSVWIDRLSKAFQSHRFTLSAGGLAVGLSIPLLCVFLSSIWNVDGFAYLSFFIPISFMTFGFVIGWLFDKFFEQKKLLEKANLFLKEQSDIDELTGVYNRRHAMRELQKEIDRARRYKKSLAGIMIDVDDFKKFNDKFGHLLGDYVLKEVSHLFEQCTRTIDVVGRYGGDEFIIILPEAAPDTGQIVAERINRSVNTHSFTFKKKPIKVTLSIGVAHFDDLTAVDATEFIEKTDKSLHEAKSAGKNRVAALRQ